MTITTVKVLYKFVDGAHFFVSNDEASAGLCVAHNELEMAFEAVETQLAKLYKKNHDIDAVFSPTMTTIAFVSWFNSHLKSNAKTPSPGIAGTIPWISPEMPVLEAV